MNGLGGSDRWAPRSSARPSAPRNKYAGACPTFVGGRMEACTVAEGTLQEDCCANRKNTQRKSTITDNDEEVGICESECFTLIILSQTLAACLEEVARLC